MKTFMKPGILLALLFPAIAFTGHAQTRFRSGMFLHHSTGAYIWGPNPDNTSTTTIPAQAGLYNASHGLTGSDTVSMSENWWEPPSENDWYLMRKFVDGDTAFSNGLSPDFSFQFCLDHYRILVLKSCYPSSDMSSYGGPADTLDPALRSVYNYKWHWRNMAGVMRSHPDHFFVLWTNAPMIAANTSPEAAAFSKMFCTWAKDTLAAGTDPEFGPFPLNVYVFDYYGKLTDNNGFMKTVYAIPSDTYHPDGAATDLIAPQFVSEIFDHAIAYENLYGINNGRTMKKDLEIFPNPAYEDLCIRLKSSFSGEILLTNCRGTVERQVNISGSGSFRIDLRDLPGGVYFITLRDGATGGCSFGGTVIRTKRYPADKPE